MKDHDSSTNTSMLNNPVVWTAASKENHEIISRRNQAYGEYNVKWQVDELTPQKIALISQGKIGRDADLAIAMLRQANANALDESTAKRVLDRRTIDAVRAILEVIWIGYQGALIIYASGGLELLLQSSQPYMYGENSLVVAAVLTALVPLLRVGGDSALDECMGSPEGHGILDVLHRALQGLKGEKCPVLQAAAVEVLTFLLIGGRGRQMAEQALEMGLMLEVVDLIRNSLDEVTVYLSLKVCKNVVIFGGGAATYQIAMQDRWQGLKGILYHMKNTENYQVQAMATQLIRRMWDAHPAVHEKLNSWNVKKQLDFFARFRMKDTPNDEEEEREKYEEETEEDIHKLLIASGMQRTVVLFKKNYKALAIAPERPELIGKRRKQVSSTLPTLLAGNSMYYSEKSKLHMYSPVVVYQNELGGIATRRAKRAVSWHGKNSLLSTGSLPSTPIAGKIRSGRPQTEPEAYHYPSSPSLLKSLHLAQKRSQSSLSLEQSAPVLQIDPRTSITDPNKKKVSSEVSSLTGNTEFISQDPKGGDSVASLISREAGTGEQMLMGGSIKQGKSNGGLVLCPLNEMENDTTASGDQSPHVVKLSMDIMSVGSQPQGGLVAPMTDPQAHSSFLKTKGSQSSPSSTQRNSRHSWSKTGSFNNLLPLSARSFRSARETPRTLNMAEPQEDRERRRLVRKEEGSSPIDTLWRMDEAKAKKAKKKLQRDHQKMLDKIKADQHRQSLSSPTPSQTLSRVRPSRNKTAKNKSEVTSKARMERHLPVHKRGLPSRSTRISIDNSLQSVKDHLPLQTYSHSGTNHLTGFDVAFSAAAEALAMVRSMDQRLSVSKNHDQQGLKQQLYDPRDVPCTSTMAYKKRERFGMQNLEPDGALGMYYQMTGNVPNEHGNESPCSDQKQSDHSDDGDIFQSESKREQVSENIPTSPVAAIRDLKNAIHSKIPSEGGPTLSKINTITSPHCAPETHAQEKELSSIEGQCARPLTAQSSSRPLTAGSRKASKPYPVGCKPTGTLYLLSNSFGSGKEGLKGLAKKHDVGQQASADDSKQTQGDAERSKETTGRQSKRSMRKPRPIESVSKGIFYQLTNGSPDSKLSNQQMSTPSQMTGQKLSHSLQSAQMSARSLESVGGKNENVSIRKKNGQPNVWSSDECQRTHQQMCNMDDDEESALSIYEAEAQSLKSFQETGTEYQLDGSRKFQVEHLPVWPIHPHFLGLKVGELQSFIDSALNEAIHQVDAIFQAHKTQTKESNKTETSDILCSSNLKAVPSISTCLGKTEDCQTEDKQSEPKQGTGQAIQVEQSDLDTYAIHHKLELPEITGKNPTYIGQEYFDDKTVEEDLRTASILTDTGPCFTQSSILTEDAPLRPIPHPTKQQIPEFYESTDVDHSQPEGTYDKDKVYHQHHHSQAGTPGTSNSGAWERLYDHNSGCYYYLNPQTEESYWEKIGENESNAISL